MANLLVIVNVRKSESDKAYFLCECSPQFGEIALGFYKNYSL